MIRPARTHRSLAGQVVLVAAVALAGCVGGPSRPPGPVVSPTGIVYPPGTPPTETRQSQTATLYLRSDEPERALELSLEGIAEDPANPVHYFLAGVAQARLGAHEAADTLFAHAQRIYPAYELDIEPERHAAWAEAYNRGGEAYADDDIEGAIRAWQGAARIYRLRPEAHRSLAQLLAQEGRFEESATVYAELLEGLSLRPATRVLTEAELAERSREAGDAEGELAQVLLLTARYAEAEPLLRRRVERRPDEVEARLSLAEALGGQGRSGESFEIYDGLLDRPALAEPVLVRVGVALFRAGDPARAARAFERITAVHPESRDAWYNYANALLAAEEWDRLVDIGERLLAVDPLGENAMLIVARAHLETGDERAALEHLQRIDQAPVLVERLQMRRAGAATVLQGDVVGRDAEAGTDVALRFTFYGEGGISRSDVVHVAAPAPGERRSFELTVALPASSFRYALDRPGIQD